MSNTYHYVRNLNLQGGAGAGREGATPEGGPGAARDGRLPPVLPPWYPPCILLFVWLLNDLISTASRFPGSRWKRDEYCHVQTIHLGIKSHLLCELLFDMN